MKRRRGPDRVKRRRGPDRIRRSGRALPPAGPLTPERVLYWIYAARLAVCLGVYGTAALATGFWTPGAVTVQGLDVRTLSFVGLGAAALFTPVAYWHSHWRDTRPGTVFLFSQAVLDVLLVTGIVHITGGSASVFPPLLYVALVSAYALVLPIAAAELVALGTGLAYVLDIGLAYPEQLDVVVLVQIGIFVFVATASWLIASRLRQIRQELRTLEGELERLQLGTADILRTIEAGVVTLDSDGRVAYLNPAAEEILGIEAEDWLGRDLMPELESRAAEVASLARETLSEGHQVRNRDAEIARAEDGELRPAVVHTALHRKRGAPSSVTLVLQDMRMARQFELLRLRTGRLEAVAELSASLAHEIKNPLASIRSAVEQLAQGAPEDGDEGMLSRLIVRETDRLSRLLGEFSDFARVDVVERKPLDAERLIREVIEMVQQRPEAQGGRARFEIDVREPLDDLWGDPDLVHRTLANLVLNAVQVGAEDPPVTVRVVADILRPDPAARDPSLGAPVRIRVMDDGPGIDPDDLHKIFDPFYTRRQGGSGMGLAIAHRAVQAHGGTLLVSSEPGRGATFAVLLPRRERGEEREVTNGGTAESDGE